jgi:hypothetical protein
VRASIKTTEEDQSGKRVSSNSQSNIHFVRVTELSRSRPDQSTGSVQMLTVNSPRVSQGPTQFVRKSVIINNGEELKPTDKATNGRFSNYGMGSNTGLDIYSNTKLPEPSNPYFIKLDTSDKPRTSSASSRSRSPLTSSRIRMLKVESSSQGLKTSRTPTQVISNTQQSDYFRSRQEFIQIPQPVLSTIATQKIQ